MVESVACRGRGLQAKKIIPAIRGNTPRVQRRATRRSRPPRQFTHSICLTGRDEEESKTNTVSVSSGLEMRVEPSKSATKTKGLSFMNLGKWDPLWMEKWANWYRYVKAMARKLISSASNFFREVGERAANAKIAWSS